MRNKRFIYFGRIVMLGLFSGFCWISPVFPKGSGGQPGQFLSWGAGARSLGMGKAFYAVSDDASATYWNPAGLTQLDRKEVMALHTILFVDTTYDFVSYVQPTASLGVFGFNYTRLFSGGFEKVEIAFNPDKTEIVSLRTLGTFDNVQQALTMAYGKMVFENIALGVSGKYLQNTLDTSSNGFITLDASLLALNIYSNMRFGFGVQNLVHQKFGDTEDKLPITFRLGTAYKTLKDKLLLSLDIDKNVRANLGWHIGAEYWVINFAALRLGFEGESGLRESTAGLGLAYRDYSLDYAFAIHDLGMSHRLSASWRFGPSVVENRQSEFVKLTRAGLKAYRDGDFLVATEKLNQALNVDPSNRDIQQMTNRLQRVVGFIPSATAADEESELVRKSIIAYVEGDLNTAINALRYALTKYPENEKVLSLLNSLEKEGGMKTTEPLMKEEGVVRYTIIDQKIFAARQAIINNKPDQALLKCQEILDLEPRNITALEIMGSAFFLMDQKDKAKRVWEKVLELDPENKVVREFIDQIR